MQVLSMLKCVQRVVTPVEVLHQRPNTQRRFLRASTSQTELQVWISQQYGCNFNHA
ncbi:hypothetical protein LEMLEM_LOCUS18741 [Lemmus lemmus]